MNIVLLGPPASGKGTLSDYIVEKYNYIHISMGDLLRDAVKNRSKHSSQIEQAINSGNILEEHITAEVLKEYLDKENLYDNILLDGYPRGMLSVELLQKFLNVDAVIKVDVSEEAIKNRVMNRMRCTDCGRSYNKLQYTLDKCEVCGGELQTRSDDNLEVLETRLKAYREITMPVLDYYEKIGKLFTVDADCSIQKMYERMDKTMQDIQKKIIDNMNLLVIGAPASGKGTICKKLSKDFGFKHISTGDLFRAEIASGSEKGKLIAKYINAGKLAPTPILIDTMKSFLSKPENQNNMLLDGFGKTLEEAKELDGFYRVDKVLYLDAKYEDLVKRITVRRICADCGNITTIHEAENEICPNCKGKLKQRDDDNEEVYKVRFDVFQNQTFPIVEYFESQGKLYRVDANKAPNEVYDEIVAVLGKKNSKNPNRDEENSKNY